MPHTDKAKGKPRAAVGGARKKRSPTTGNLRLKPEGPARKGEGKAEGLMSEVTESTSNVLKAEMENMGP